MEPAFALLTPGERAEFTVSVFVDRLTARVHIIFVTLKGCAVLWSGFWDFVTGGGVVGGLSDA